MVSGKLIVIEGSCDGIGKTTQKELLEKRLRESNIDFISHHFPSYGKPQASIAEMYQNGVFGNIKELSPYLINNIYAIDRSITWTSELKKSYDSGKVVLLDRYTTSSILYQSALIDTEEEKLKFINYVYNFEFELLKIKKPDLVIFLNVPYSTAKNLMDERNEKNDQFEKDQEYLKKVADNSLDIAKKLNWSIINCTINDKMKPINDIHEDIVNVIKEKLNINL